MGKSCKMEKKPYEKPCWEKQAIFEKFALACCKTHGNCSSNGPLASGGAGAKS